MLEWDRYIFNKKRARTRYAELEFLHPMGFVGHIVHCSVFKAESIDVLFFMLRWAQCSFHKRHVRTCYAEIVFCIQWDMSVTWCILVHTVRETLTYYFFCSSGLNAFSIKMRCHTVGIS
jgi:hypothetical protein